MNIKPDSVPDWIKIEETNRTHQNRLLLLLLVLSACSFSSSSYSCFSSPESPDDDRGRPELLAGYAEPPTDGPRGGEAGGRSRGSMEEEQEKEEKVLWENVKKEEEVVDIRGMEGQKERRKKEEYTW